MTETPHCPRCGAPLAGATEDPCPACLLQIALEPESPGSDDATRLTPPGASQPSAPASTPRALDQIGPYRIVRVLGEGGMGVVYLAEQSEPIRRTVALKVIKLGMDTRDVVARFETERQALALMDHPHIARVIDAGATPDGRPFFVMEYVVGVPITEYCDAHRLSTRARLELVAQVCAAVQHAHQKGVIHRDLKPSNVLVTEQDAVPAPKIIDFGIAKATDQRLAERTMFTEAGQFMGTPEYMSPEQTGLAGLDVDATTDIYSLGVLLYELLVGRLPFEPAELRKAGYAEMQRIIREVEPPRPSTRVGQVGDAALDAATQRRTDPGGLRKTLSRDLDWITLKALEKDRARRYQSASELAADIARYLNYEPVEASPPSAAYRAQKFVRRNRLAVTAAALVAFAVIGGLIVSSVLYVKEGRARREAVAQKAFADEQRTAATDARQKSDLNAARADTNAARAEEQRILADDQRIEADRQRADAMSQAYISGLTSVATGLKRFVDGSEPGMELLRLSDLPRDLRNWEWRFLAAQLDATSRVFFAPSAASGPLAFSVEGLVLWPTDRVLAGWDIRTGRRTLFASDEDPIAALDPSGRFLLRIRGGRQARVIDITTSQTVATLPESDRVIVVAAFSPRGSLLATATAEGVVRLWRPQSGTLIRDVAGVTGTPTAMLMAPDDSALLVVTRATTFLASLVAPAAAQPIAALKGATAIFTPDSLAIWHAGADGKVRQMEVTSGRETRVLAGFDDTVIALAASSDGQWLATVDDTSRVRLWDVASGTPVAILLAAMVESAATTLAFTPDGRSLVAATDGAQAVFWDVTRVRLAHGVSVGGGGDRKVALSVDGRWAVATDGSTITRRDLEARPLQQVGLVGRRPTDVIKVVAVAADGRVAAGTDAGAVLFWSRADREPVPLDTSLNGGVTTLEFSGDGHRLAAGSATGDVRVWEAATGRVRLRMTLTAANARATQVRSRVTSRGLGVTFDASGERLITQRPAGGVAVFPDIADLLTSVVEYWDVASGRRVSERRYQFLESVAFTVDGTRALALRASKNPMLTPGRIEIRRTTDDVLLAESEIRLMGLTHAAVSPDGSRLAAVDDNGSIHIIDGRTGRLLLSTTDRAGEPVAVRFSRDGVRLTAAYENDVVRVLDATTSFSVNFAVNAAIDGLWGAADPLAQVRSDPQLTARERVAAERSIAQARDRDPAEAQNAGSWAIAGEPRRSVAAYRDAVSSAQRAVDLVPWSPEYVGSLGVAQFRAGDHTVAEATLTRSLDRWLASAAAWKANTGNGFKIANGRMIFGDGIVGPVLASEAIVRAFRAMCLQKLGRTADARADVERVRVIAKRDQSDTRLATFLKEADETVTAAEARSANNGALILKARALVNTLFATPSMFADDVVERLESDLTVPADIRAVAVRFAQALVDDPADLNRASWAVVKKPGATAVAYQVAMKRAEKATRLQPDLPARLNTLALAHYRVGRYNEAWATLDRVRALRTPIPSDAVVSILIRLRLGQLDAARVDLEALLKVTSLAEDTQALVKEAQALSESLLKKH